MSDVTDANERFDELWNDTGKQRIRLGDDDKGVEIRVDIDLSPLALMKRMQHLSEQGLADGLLEDKAHQALSDARDSWEQALSDKMPTKVRDRWSKLLGVHR